MKALILLLPIALFIVGCGGDEDAALRESMWEAAQESVKDQLKSPASAVFPELPSEFKVTTGDEGTIYESDDLKFFIFKTKRAGTVNGWVDAKNPMGTPMRNKFIVSMVRGDNDEWDATPPTLEK